MGRYALQRLWQMVPVLFIISIAVFSIIHFIPGNPAKPYHDEYYDPLYAVAVELGLPLTFHRTFGGKPSEADWDELVNQQVTVSGTVYRFFSAAKPFTYMTYGGVFERHPALKIVGGEASEKSIHITVEPWK